MVLLLVFQDPLQHRNRLQRICIAAEKGEKKLQQHSKLSPCGTFYLVNVCVAQQCAKELCEDEYWSVCV